MNKDSAGYFKGLYVDLVGDLIRRGLKPRHAAAVAQALIDTLSANKEAYKDSYEHDMLTRRFDNLKRDLDFERGRINPLYDASNYQMGRIIELHERIQDLEKQAGREVGVLVDADGREISRNDDS